MPDGEQYDTAQLDEVQHPTLGALKFPHEMPPDERNASIDRMLQKKPAAPAAPEPSFTDRAISGAKNFGVGALKGVGHTLGGLSPLINKIPGIGETLAPSEGIKAWDQVTKPEGTAQKVGFGGEQAAEFLLPTGLEEKAGAFAAKAIPQAGKAAPALARLGTAALNSGVINKLQGGTFKGGAEAGAAFGALGEGGRAIAPSLAETALGVTKRLRGFGRTPGEAALEEIKGIRPETIATNARAQINRLTGAVEHLASTSTVPAATDPAIKIVDQEIQKAMRQNSKGLYDQLQAMRERLTTDVFSGQPHAPIANGRVGADIPARKILDLKRGIGDLENSWNPESRGPTKGIVRKVYRALDNELDRAVPEARDLNQKISSLIPVSQRAESTTRGASTTQKVAHRVAAHTGALAGSLVGGGYGYDKGGLPGAVAGATAGLVLPELLSSPTAMMTAARAARSGLPAKLARGTVLAGRRQLSPETEGQ